MNLANLDAITLCVPAKLIAVVEFRCVCPRVFFIHARESLTYHYERSFVFDSTDPEPDPQKKRKIFDPRVAHQMTLEVDGFGNVRKSVAIAYSRRTPEHSEQGQTLVTYTENRVTNKPDENNWYRIGVPIETITYEMTGLPAVNLYTLEEVREQVANASHLDYELKRYKCGIIIAPSSQRKLLTPMKIALKWLLMPWGW